MARQTDTRDRWSDLESLLTLVESAWFTEEHPITISSRNFDSDTPLHTVISWGDFDAACLLMKEGADVNARGEDGNTSLHHAILMGEFQIARVLLVNGADKELRNDENMRAQDMCWEGEWVDLFGEPGNKA